MHAKMDVKDTTHPHVLAAARALARRRRAGSRDGHRRRPTRVQKGEPVTLTADVLDPEYQGRQRRPHHARTSPRRRARSKTCRWSGRSSTTASTARASRRPRTGSTRSRRRHDARTARTSAAARVDVRVAPSDAEYFDAAMRAPLLRALADETDGRFFRRQGRVAARRRDHLQRQGHHGRRRARAVGHADHPGAAARVHGRRVAVSAVARAGVDGGSMRTRTR